MRLLLVTAVLAVSALPARAVDRKEIDAAVERGVAALKKLQRPDGSWPHVDSGATALAGLTLLECGVAKNDKAVTAAAARVRQASLNLTHVYSLALSILFLDRLDDPADTPLIESMIVRLLAGQNATGSWNYNTPPITDLESRRLVAESTGRLVKTGRDLSRLPERGKRTAKDLAPEIRAQLQVVGRGGGPGSGDNSNTQFAILALWVGRRYGVPTQGALIRTDKYFRLTQRKDGSWAYTSTPVVGPGIGQGSPAMTCAGILGLAFGHGSLLDLKKAKNPKAETRDISGDASMKAALQVLSTAVGNPVGWNGGGFRPRAISPVAGKGYYFLWSLERVCVALKLDTIGKKQWYDWGAEILLANQSNDGSWQGGEHGAYGADTCFALLFLKRANFTRDLSSGLAGAKDPGKLLRVGGVGGDTLKGGSSNLESSGVGKKSAAEGTPGDTTPKTVARKDPSPKVKDRDPPAQTSPRTAPKTAEEKAAARLSSELPKASSERRGAILKEMRDARGVAYTEALIGVISHLDGDARKEARIALAERLTRMRPATLRNYLQDDEPEIRRAAALATAAKGNKDHVPDLIRLLSDAEPLVQRAAHHSLKKLAGKDFGPDEDATASQRKAAVAAWLKWWKAQSRE